MRRQLLFYSVMIFSFVVLLAVILHIGTGLQVAIPNQGTSVESPSTNTIQNLFSSFQQPLTILLLQIVVIIVVARVTGFLFEKINQPAVIGEMVAGILLGPSLLGILSPKVEVFLFPASTMDILKILNFRYSHF